MAKGVLSCAIGYDHSIALCGDGLYIGGRFLGKIHNPPTRIPFFNGRAVRLVASGDCSEHVLVYCDDGLFAMGANSCGQLGLGDTYDRDSPQEIIHFHDRRVGHVAIGQHSSLVLCEGTLYSFGAGLLCGSGSKSNQVTPAKVTFFEGRVILDVACGRRSALVLCEDGLYHFGQGINCQHVVRLLPERIAFFNTKVVTRIAVGGDHYLALCDDRDLFTFGRNSCGELGHGDLHSTTDPKPVTALKPRDVDGIAAGMSLSMLLTASGELLAFGDGFDGRLGNGVHANVSDKPRFTFPTVVPAITPLLEAIGYVEQRTQPLAKVPGTLTQGSKPPPTQEESERLRQHEKERQQRLAEQRSKLQEDKKRREAEERSAQQQREEREQRRRQEIERMHREKGERLQLSKPQSPPEQPKSAEATANGALVQKEVEMSLHKNKQTALQEEIPSEMQEALEREIRSEVETRFKQHRSERSSIEEHIQKEIDTRAKNGPASADGGAEERVRKEMAVSGVEARVQREIGARSGRPADSADSHIREQVEERVRAELARRVQPQSLETVEQVPPRPASTDGSESSSVTLPSLDDEDDEDDGDNDLPRAEQRSIDMGG